MHATLAIIFLYRKVTFYGLFSDFLLITRIVQMEQLKISKLSTVFKESVVKSILQIIPSSLHRPVLFVMSTKMCTWIQVLVWIWKYDCHHLNFRIGELERWSVRV